MSSQKRRAVNQNSVDNIFSNTQDQPFQGEMDKDLLMRDLIGIIKKHVILDDHAALSTALWIILSWSSNLFERCPILIINAPERECGKTQLLRVVEKLSYKPLETSNITMAVLFRMITKYGPTILIDEADTFMEGKSEMAGLFNKGYERGGFVMRMESRKDEMVECAYVVYGPKAVAGISLERHLPDATMSRGIQIPLRRKTQNESVERFRATAPQVFQELRSRISRFVQDNREVLAQGWKHLPKELSDRQQDNWEPLLAIAHCLGSEWYGQAIVAAMKISVETSPPKSTSNQLLEDIRQVLEGYEGRFIPSATLLAKLCAEDDMDWDKYNRGNPITSRQLARNLMGYNVKSKTVRMGPTSTPKGFEVHDFQDAFNRYLSSQDSYEDPPEDTGPSFHAVPMTGIQAGYPIPTFSLRSAS